MSCFNGQMKEYNRIAIDRFDGKNLQCTAFFLSHCHKEIKSAFDNGLTQAELNYSLKNGMLRDKILSPALSNMAILLREEKKRSMKDLKVKRNHMVGLNSSNFANSLHTRNGIFLYCSEITRLLLLAEEDYHHLQKYIRVLKVGMPQPVSVPSNSTSVADYYVNVTLISAGHCPGSVMFLFEGHEGRCLYTGDFRWEANHAAGIAVFKEENRLKHIKSIYVDTTFCIPEAFHIPSRIGCIDAAVTLVADWLQRSALNVVFMSCPARYGYEHLLMELSVKLNIKIHVPEWKTKIYDRIPDLQNVFTSDPTQTRIHACSAKMSYTSSLPCHRSSERKHVSVLNLRPSAMWFTSEKSTAKREDLVVPPASPKGLYRICYSLHSSYSEIRDLVSYLQPENAFPNVQPVSDASIEVVQTRLHSFQKHVNSARVKMSVGKLPFQPLGTLRQIVSVYTTMQKQQNIRDAESSSELVFSSQEADAAKGLLRSTTGSSSHLSRAGKLEGNNSFSPAECEGPSADGALSSSISNAHSSYKGSVVSDEELLFPDSGGECRKSILCVSKGDCDNRDAGSLHMYLSGNSDAPENVLNGECEACPNDDHDKDAIIAHSATHEVDVCAVGSSKCAGSQSTRNVSLIRQQKPRKASAISTSHASEIGFRSQHIHESNAHEQFMTNVTMSSGASMSIRPSSRTEVDSTTKNNNLANSCTTVHIFKDDDDSDIVFSSQVSSRTELIQNHVLTTISDNTSAISDQEEEDHEAAAKNITNNYTSLKTFDPQISDAVAVLSSSDDSLNTLEQESQTLWSVSYSLDNFVHSSYHSHQVTDTEISFGNSVFSTHTGKENSSLKQTEGATLHTTEQQQSPCFNPGNAQFTVNRNAKELKSYPALKRKYISNITVNERSLKGIKRSTNDNKCDSVAEIKNQGNSSGKRATGLKNSFSRLKESSLSKYKVTGSERNICRVENIHPVSSSCTQRHMQNSDRCPRHSAGDVCAQSVQIFEESDWIDLTIESSAEVVDLTLEDSP